MRRAVVAAVLALSFGALPLVPAGASGGWTIAPSASPASGAGINLRATACASAGSCFAIGGSHGTPYAEHWNGTRWSPVAVPLPADRQIYGYPDLLDIACPSATTCFTLGYAIGGAFMVRWNGAAWSIVPGTGLVGQPGALACPSDTSCFAVGFGGGSASIQHWDGTKWAVSPSPVVDPVQANLAGITCVSETSCYAVGSVYAGDGRTLVEHWDGTAWNLVASPNPSGTQTTLTAISCATDTACFAVGHFDAAQSVGPPLATSLIERWNGTKWSIIPSPNAGGRPGDETENRLNAVTCTSETSCFATRGINGADQPTRSTVDHWNGTSWSVSTTLTVDPSYNLLTGVACAAASTCFAVGYVGLDPQLALIERWNGSKWSVSDERVSPAPPNSALSGVTCPTPATCFAVGHFTNTSGHVSTLVERKTGSSWQRIAAPNKVGGKQSTLAAVSCASTTACFAVGTYLTAKNRVQTLIDRWNGHAWANMPSPDNPHSANSGTNQLTAVSCATATMCFAVGSYDNGSLKTLIEQWDGTKWTIVKSPNRNRIEHNVLEGVSCPSVTTCFAVGKSDTDGGTRPLIERWDGKAWTITPSPDVPGPVFDDLAAVSCASTKMCVAVGGLRSSPTTTPLVLRWNGVAWSRMTSTVAADANTTLLGVACPSATRCLAVGTTTPRTPPGRPIAKVLTGTTWSSSAPVTPTGATNSLLTAVACPTAAQCFAVGDYETTGATHTLVEAHT